MGKQNWFTEQVLKIEYYFAKRWLDKNFGENDYWGDYIQYAINNSVIKPGDRQSNKE